MNINTTTSMQIKKMNNTVDTQSNGMGRMMSETLQMLPQETQADIKSLMQTLDPKMKKDAMSQMSQIESSNMTVEDLTAAIMDIFNPTQETDKSSFPSSFSAYA